jgi:hypothetical protein
MEMRISDEVLAYFARAGAEEARIMAIEARQALDRHLHGSLF